MRCNYEGKDFGASYIDSICIDGQLYDLDDCDSDGNLYDKGYVPCPRCKTWDFLRMYHDIDRGRALVHWIVLKIRFLFIRGYYPGSREKDNA